MTAEPTVAGFITNTVTVASPNTTNTAATNVVVQVTNLVVLADLGVTMTGPGQAVITNDWMTYGVTVTNAGPSCSVECHADQYLAGGRDFDFSNEPGGEQQFGLQSGHLDQRRQYEFAIHGSADQRACDAILCLRRRRGNTWIPTPPIISPAPTSSSPIIFQACSWRLPIRVKASIFRMPWTEQSIMVSNAGPAAVPAVRVVVTGVSQPIV